MHGRTIPLGVGGQQSVARLEALAREHEGLVEEYKGKRLVTVVGDRDHQEKPHGDTFTVAFLDPGLIALGQTGVVKRSIDRQGGQSVLDNHEMMNLVHDLDSANAWAVGRFDTLISQARLPEGVAGQIPAVRWFSASGHINGGLRGSIRADARDEQAAQNLRDVVQGFLALARMQTGAKPELQALVNSLQLSGSGKTVNLRFEVPAKVLDMVTSAKKNAVEASQDFTAPVLLKPARLKAVPAGSWARPYTPRASATAAATSAGTR